MEDNRELNDYVSTQRQLGQSDAYIKNQLLSQGWDQQQVESVINPLSKHPIWQQGPDLPPPVAPPPKREMSNNKKSLLFLIPLGATLLIIGLVVLVVSLNSKSKESETPVVPIEEVNKTRTIEDPNFTITVPDAWYLSGNYTAGNDISFLYSPEQANESTSAKAAKVAIYAPGIVSRVDDRIAATKPGTYEKVVDETFTLDGIQHRYVELKINLPVSPELLHRFVITSSSCGEKAVDADAIVLEEHWTLHEKQVPEILKSLKPVCEQTAQ